MFVSEKLFQTTVQFFITKPASQRCRVDEELLREILSLGGIKGSRFNSPSTDGKFTEVLYAGVIYRHEHKTDINWS